MSEFPRSVLGDLIVHQKGFPFKSRDYQEDGVPVVRVSNFTDDSIDASDLKFVSENIASENQKVALRTDDVIIATVGSWPKNPASIVGKTICVPPEMDGALMNQNSVILRVKSNSSVDQKYLFIVLKTKLFSEYLVSTAQGSANQASVTLSDIFSYEVEWPEKEIRESIVSMIDSMNQKITLNRQTNQTLEQIAQAIFKSWFVDFEPVKAKIKAKQEWAKNMTAKDGGNDEIAEINFVELAALCAISGKTEEQFKGLDEATLQQLKTTAALFPDDLVDSELGGIPDGWEVRPLGNYIKIKRGGSPRPIKDYIVEKGFPWTKIADATAEPSPFLFKTKECIREEGLKKTTLLKKGSLILSNSATPGLPKFLELDACIHDGWLHFPEKKLFTNMYLYQLFLVIRKELVAQGNGSVFTNLKTDILRNQVVVAPSQEVIDQFDKTVTLIFIKLKENCKEINTLVDIRDTLLPKLLSGELAIAEPSNYEVNK